MLNVNAMLIAALFSLSAAAAAPVEQADGQSLALRDDAGVVVLSWDGETARVYRQGEVQATYQSDSWDEVMWNVNVPSHGSVTAPHRYDRALTAAEIGSLDTCNWGNETTMVECGLDASCDCSASGSFQLASVQ